MSNRFLLDRPNGKALGVCAGLARMSGADVTVLRIATVLSLLLLGPLTILIYLLAAWIAPDRV